MTVEEAAAEIRALAAVRPRGGGTKLGWSHSPKVAADFDTRRLNRILEHNEGDFTAVLEAGVPLVEAQAAFGAAGQMLALDPPASRHASRIRPDSSSARSASPSTAPSKHTSGCRLPSPAWNTLATWSSCSAASSSI